MPHQRDVEKPTHRVHGRWTHRVHEDTLCMRTHCVHEDTLCTSAGHTVFMGAGLTGCMSAGHTGYMCEG